MYVGRFFARLFFVLLETKDSIIDFCLLNNRPLPKKREWGNLSLFKQLCIQYIEIIEFFEKDVFGASSYFLLYIDIKQDRFNELTKSLFKDAIKVVKEKVSKFQKSIQNFGKELCRWLLL